MKLNLGSGQKGGLHMVSCSECGKNEFSLNEGGLGTPGPPMIYNQLGIVVGTRPGDPCKKCGRMVYQ